MIFFALLLVPVFGLPLYLEANNALAQGLVVGKREEITMRRLFWSLRASLSGAFPWIIVIAIWLALLAGAPYPRHLHRRGAVPHEQLAGARSARLLH